jgi:hypothetical protein
MPTLDRRLLAAILVALLTGCAAASAPPLTGSYDDAIDRSAVFGQDKVHRLLTIDGTAKPVSVVTWTSKDTADKFYPPGPNRVGVDVWVTRVPQLQNSCAAFPADPDALRLRLQQFLGLPAAPGARVVVLLEVDPADIFRPCPDPDPAKSECAATFPPGIDTAYKAWFAEQVLARYRQPDGYPWTRLGYTYDWAPGSTTIGASEFVIRKGAAVTVTATVPTGTYCHGSGR